MKNVLLRLGFLVVTLGASIGCGSFHLQTKYTTFGAVDIARDKAINERLKKLRDEPPGAEKDVVVLVDLIPAGIETSLSMIKVLPGFEHRLLGRFSMGPKGSLIPGFFSDYRDGWRKGLCYWQDPLVWVTLTLWWLVPTNYPCWGKYTNDKGDIVAKIKKVAATVGGDTAIISFIVDVDGENAWGARGFIIKLDPRMKGKPLDTTPVPKKPAGGPI